MLCYARGVPERSSSVVPDSPELPADVLIAVFEQQDGRLVDLDGSAVPGCCAGVINVCLRGTSIDQRTCNCSAH